MGVIERQFAEQFAHEWIEAWNGHDLDRILSHYTDDFELRSPRIVELMGEASGTLVGKQAIRPYWAKALTQSPPLKFELHTILCGVDGIVLYYKNSRGRLAAERFEFAESGLVVRSSVHYDG
jgi:ketosteroid isomerase-like protein